MSKPADLASQLPAALDGFDLTDQARFASGFPHAVFARLRRDAPVLFHPPGHTADGVGFWVLSKHADVAAAAEDPALSSSGGPGRPHGGTHIDDARPELPGVMINMMDDPRHRAFKDALAPALGPPPLAALEASLRAYTADLVATLAGRGACDFAAETAAIGVHAIALLLGVPPQDRPTLAGWTDVLMGFDDREASRPTERSKALHMELFRYGQRLLADRRATPADDLTSVLARAELPGAPAGGPLTERERQTTFCLMTLAGTESTRNAIAGGVLALIQHPEQWRALRDDRALLPGAVEEILRWTTPTPYNRRTAARDLRIRDAEIRAGDKVTLWWASANRDEDVFAAPLAFDVRRAPNPHLSFGAGTHGCFGAQLGRLELRLVLEALLDRVESLDLAGPIAWAASNKHTVVVRMPVTLRPRRALRVAPLPPPPPTTTTAAPAPRTPLAWLRDLPRQVTAAWRESFLGSGPSVVPPELPELRGYPLIGSLPAFRDDLIGVLQATSALGPVARFRLLGVPFHVVTDLEIAREMLIEKLDSLKKTRELSVYLQPLTGNGLLAADGALHHRHRKLLAPAFSPRRVATYGELMVEETIQQVARWTPSRRVNLTDEMTMLTLTIVGRALFGRGMRAETAQIADAFTDAMRAMMKRITGLVQAPYAAPLPSHRQMRRAVATLDEVVQRLITQRRAEGGDRGDVLSMLLLARDEADGSGLTDKEVRDEIITLLAGHEATASALTWTWYELGRNPAVVDQLAAEVDAVLGERPVTVPDLPRLPYTLAVVEEALRLHPPVYALSREATCDLELGGHRFGARSSIFINMYGIYRHPAYYPDPLAFKPERMTPEAKKARPRYAYLPFGDGPRVCIGAHFAILELQLALATMIQRGRVEVEPGERHTDPLMTLRLRGGLPATVGPRRK